MSTGHLTVKLETITPEQAALWLTRNSSNRPIRRTRVARYAEAMRRGHWRVNGETVIFDGEGNLLNGQHRLAACVETGLPFLTLAVYGVEAAAFATMDDGATRTAADVLACSDVGNAMRVAGAARLATAYISGRALSIHMGRYDVTDFATHHPDLEALTAIVKSARLGMPDSPVIAALFLARAHHSLQLAPFLEGIRNGARLDNGDPRLTLRIWHHNERRKRVGGAMPTATVFSAVVRAWNAWAEGRTLHALRYLKDSTRETLAIHGYRRADYPDVADFVPAEPQVRVNGRFVPADAPTLL